VASVVFYDGVCGLCNRLVRFLLRRDRHARLLFASLQGDLARTVLGRHGYNASELNTVYVIADRRSPGRGPRDGDHGRWGGSDRVLARSRAILYALHELGGGWRVLALAGSLVPVRLADAAYDAIAKRRYRTFGKLASCPIPPPEWRGRFIEGEDAEKLLDTEGTETTDENKTW
jgi:predicted DCC family thiol-disulfide oxidoreductase YuxK